MRAAQVLDDNSYHAFNHRYASVKGSPYLLPDWHMADLGLKSGVQKKNVLIKYNVLDNQLLAMWSSGDSIIVAPGQVQTFVLHDLLTKDGAKLPINRSFRQYAFLLQGKPIDTYMEVLAEKQGVALVKQQRKNIITFNSEASSGYAAPSNHGNEIVTKNVYLLYKSENEVVPVDINRKSLEKALEQLGVAKREDGGAKKAEIRSEQELVAAFQQTGKP